MGVGIPFNKELTCIASAIPEGLMSKHLFNFNMHLDFVPASYVGIPFTWLTEGGVVLYLERL